jgi:hypothetical protein
VVTRGQENVVVRVKPMDFEDGLEYIAMPSKEAMMPLTFECKHHRRSATKALSDGRSKFKVSDTGSCFRALLSGIYTTFKVVSLKKLELLHLAMI